MKLYHLRTMHEEHPLGIDQPPYFSWMLESGTRNTRQVSYEILVKDEWGKTIWNSGKVASETTSFIPYEGETLANCTAYTWRVRVEDNHGETAEAQASFSTAFMNEIDADERASWITSGADYRCEPGFGNQSPANVFRREFSIAGEPLRVTIYMTSRGAYDLCVNGRVPDERHLATEYSSFDKVHFYQTYDLTHLVHPGKNRLDMTVANGWYCCPKTQLHQDYKNEVRSLLFRLQIVFPDGKIQWINSDEKTMWTDSPIHSSDIFAGELYDAREELSDHTVWTKSIVQEGTYHQLKAQIGKGILPVAVLPVQKKYISPKGEMILDFGQNIAGVVRMRTRLKAGESLTLDHFEVTDKEGNYFNSIIEGAGVGNGCEQRVQFISAGREQEYTPRFTFQGFRFVKVTAPEGYEVCPDDFEALALSNRKEQLGDFSCSDERLNRLYQNTLWSQRANMIAIPTDCPQREKAGWTGDIAVYAKTAMLNEDATSFLTRWLLSVSADQQENGAVPIAVPFSTAYQEVSKTLGKLGFNRGPMGSAGWGDAAVLVPWSMYEVTGDTSVLRQQYDSMRKWAEYIIESCKRRGTLKNPGRYEKYLWNTGFHFGDWLVPSLAKNGYDFNLFKAVMRTKGTVASLFGYQTISQMTQIARILGKKEDAKRYEDIAAHMKEAIQRTMIPKNGKLKHEFMGIYVLMLAFGVVPEEKVSLVGDHLLRMIRENGGCLDTGFLGTPWLMDALCACGHLEEAYRLLVQDQCPSWLFEVKKGATTIWESWFCYNDQDEPMGMSYNHYAFGCVDDWMFRYLGGISPMEPGFRRFSIQIPREITTIGITSGHRSFLSENGLIVCDWQIEQEKLKLHVQVPCNTTAEIHLWDGSVETVGSGDYQY